MTAAALQNEAAAALPSPATLTSEMTEQLAGFRAFLRFESVDAEQNRRRFYDLRWQPTLFGEGALVRTWGRQGQPGTTRASFYPDRANAQTEIRQVVRLRLRHGYRVLDWQ
jgi:predicted DNA-binding WGR domain protein